MNYYNSGDFDKAVLYFEKIASEKKNTVDIYQPYSTSLLEINEFKKAEKLVKQEIKKYPKKYFLIIDLGNVYFVSDKIDKANDYYQQAIKKVDNKATYNQIESLALGFEKVGKIDFALDVYQTGNQYNSNKLIYNQKIASIYNRKGETALMIKTYLALIDQSSGYLALVQRSLSNSIDLLNDKNKRSMLKESLVKESQKHPNNIVYNELLAWYFTAVNDFNSAFIQVRAVDKKANAKGAKLLEFGQSCFVNESYDVALKSYNQIILNYPQTELSGQAKAKKLKTLKAKLLSGVNVNEDQLILLKENYTNTIEEIKKYFKSYQTDKRYLDAIRGLADLEAYYLHDYKAAEDLLRNILKSYGIPLKVKGEVKIELADILLLKGDVWDASLLFMQVEKEFKEDPIGYSAKFKNARVYYYTGEYEWCQSQLDVLKASTSKLISNDAMELSLLITDNFNLDTSRLSMNLFAKADLYIVQHRYREAEQLYDSINQINAYHTLNDDILFRKAKIAIKEQRFEHAILALTKLLADYGDDILADNALFLLGHIYEHNIYDLDKAKEAYKSILFDHKGSLFMVEARKRYRKLTGKTDDIIQSDS